MIDYCKDKLSVAERTLYFISLILRHQEKKVEDFSTFEDFVKFLDKNDIKKTAGFNKNKRGYMETLKFAYSLKEEQK